MEKDLSWVKAQPRGMYFDKKEYQDTPLFTYEEVKDKLPVPVVDAKPIWKDSYDYSVKILFNNMHMPKEGSGFVSNFVDAAFNADVFLWDTVFMTVFCNLFHNYVPGIRSLDNFYCKQFEDGEIPREMVRDTGEDMPLWVNAYNKPLYSYFHNHYGFRRLKQLTNLPYEEMYKPDLGRKVEKHPYLTLDNLNHPVLGLAELQSYCFTGDSDRLKLVYEPLYRQYESYKYHLRHASGLYVTDWASMDNSPRNKHLGFGVDITSEVAMLIGQILEIMDILEAAGDPRPEFKERRTSLNKDREVLFAAINKYMWNEEDGFYYDVDKDMRQVGIKTIAGFMPMLAGACDGHQKECLVKWLNDKDTFNRIHRIPVLAANEEGFHPEGGYWSGSVWASTNSMMLTALENNGYHELAREIGRNHMDVLAQVYEKTGTIWENYPADSVTSGDADNKDFVGWSGIGSIYCLIAYGIGLQGSKDGLHWDIPEEAKKGRIGCKNYWFGGKQGDFVAELIDGILHVSIETEDSFPAEICCQGKTWKFDIKGNTELELK